MLVARAFCTGRSNNMEIEKEVNAPVNFRLS
jgi:hypothetical protein